jgi:hypothetical protein
MCSRLSSLRHFLTLRHDLCHWPLHFDLLRKIVWHIHRFELNADSLFCDTSVYHIGLQVPVDLLVKVLYNVYCILICTIINNNRKAWFSVDVLVLVLVQQFYINVLHSSMYVYCNAYMRVPVDTVNCKRTSIVSMVPGSWTRNGGCVRSLRRAVIRTMHKSDRVLQCCTGFYVSHRCETRGHLSVLHFIYNVVHVIDNSPRMIIVIVPALCRVWYMFA